jgi:hypothetical protein
VIWAKTDAGRIEMQARALVKERAQRNLLLVIDGLKSEEMLLAGLAGISASDFAALQSLGLIVPLGSSSGSSSSVRSGGTAASGRSTATSNASASAPPSAPAAPLDYASFTAALTQMISKELGLRGFVLTLAVEKAGTIEELQAVAQRTLTQIAERKGEAVAAAARRTLYGS